MAAVPTTTTTAPLRSGRRRIGDRVGDGALRTITALAALAVVVLLGAIVYKILHLAHPAWSKYGLHFITARSWDPVHKVFGALPFIYGTAISSLIALLISAPL